MFRNWRWARDFSLPLHEHRTPLSLNTSTGWCKNYANGEPDVFWALNRNRRPRWQRPMTKTGALRCALLVAELKDAIAKYSEYRRSTAKLVHHHWMGISL
jgi:hypothetical protein